MIRCPHCGTDNRAGTMFCEECGEPFVDKEGEQRADVVAVTPTGDDTIIGQKADAIAEAMREDEAKTLNPPRAAVRDQPAPASWLEGFGTPDAVVIHIPESNARIEVDMFDAPAILGRADPRISFVPEVELKPYNALELGVSRRHAMISWSEDGVTIEDLDSSNGTYLNGHRLAPHFRRLLRDGDSIMLGELVARIYFKNK